MKKKELLKRIEALEAGLYGKENAWMKYITVKPKVSEPDDLVIKPKDDTIYVPDGILGKEMYILNGNKALSGELGEWEVGYVDCGWTPSEPNQFKLAPCKRDELKAGDVAFIFHNSDGNEFNYELSNIEYYSIVTENGIVFWQSDNSGVEVCNYELNAKHVWYKVVEA